MAEHRTLWQEGQVPGRLVVRAAWAAALGIVLLSLVSDGRTGLFFDLAFVLASVAVALAVRPGEFSAVALLPPVLMLGTVFVLAVVDRSSVADDRDGIGQAIVSGLAHHATALAVGYALTLALLGLRLVALRHDGMLRQSAGRATTPAAPEAAPGVPQQRGNRQSAGDRPAV